MSAARGSKQKFKIIKETAFGTTPATPTLFEIPANSFNKDSAINLIRSGQIRSHPFVDRLLKGPETHDIEIATEFQGDTHDVILELLCGADFASNTVKVTDALKGASIESEHIDLALFDIFTGSCVRRGEFVFPAQADGIVTANYGIMCQGGLLDEAATIATAVTAAGDIDPYVFHEAVVTLNGVTKVVTSLSFTLERTVDPLYVLGEVQPHEYIPSDVTLTGQITIPLESNAESTRLTGFTAAPLIATCTKGAEIRTFDLKNINYARMGRRIQNRGVILQEIDFEAKYHLATGTIMSITRSA